MRFPTQHRIKELLFYDPDTGVFTWKVNGNGRFIGKVAGGSGHRGYLRIMVDGVKYQLHNLAWIYMTGNAPKSLIDHKDRNNLNNSFSNLREADFSQNCFNRGLTKRSTSGVHGVTWSKKEKKWRVRIGMYGKTHYLGYFKDKEDAIRVRIEAEDKYFREFKVKHDSTLLATVEGE